MTLQLIRDAWPEILAVLERTKRSAWIAAMTAKVIDYRADESVLVLGFPSQNDVQDLRGGTGAQKPAELLRAAIADVLGVQVKFLPRVIGDQAVASEPPVAEPVSPEGDGAPAAGSASTQSAPASTPPAAPTPSEPAAAKPAPAKSAPAKSAPAKSAPAPSAPVDSWTTVAIPSDDPAGAEAPASRADTDSSGGSLNHQASSAKTATAVAEAPAAASDLIGAPDDADAPPDDDVEPPFDAGPAAEIVAEPSRPTATARPAASVDGGIQRYGESVVREVLGATFLEEVEAPGRPGFGERG